MTTDQAGAEGSGITRHCLGGGLRAAPHERKGKREHRPLADLATGREFAVHQFGKLARDRKAEAGTRSHRSRRGAGFKLRELFENVVQLVRRDAGSGIDHADHDLAVLFARPDPHRTFFGELDRIADEIEDDLAHAQFVAHALGQVGRDFHVERDTLGLGVGFEQTDAAADQMAVVDRFARQLHTAGLDLRQIEQLVEQPQHRLARIRDHPRIFVMFVGQLALEQQVGETDHPVHRRADFMAHIGEEMGLGLRGAFGLVARLAQLLLRHHGFGDVLEDTENRDHFAGRRGLGMAHASDVAQFAIRADDACLEAEILAFLEGFADHFADPLAVLFVIELEAVGDGRCEIAVDPVNTIDLIRPDQRVLLNIDAPVPDIGNLLRHLQQAVVFANARIAFGIEQLFASPPANVAHHADIVAKLAILVPARGKMGFEPDVVAISMAVTIGR